MKSILLTVGLAFIGMYATAQTRVIDYPVMGQRTTDALEFYQAEVSDTAVILRGDMYSRPNYWVRIASSSVLKGKETGKVYRLIPCYGDQTGSRRVYARVLESLVFVAVRAGR